MEKLITGIHHVTAIAADAQKNIDFYAGILGIRLVKKTVNFDASEVYHFYYGDELGHPGSILTFFPYKGLTNGRHGKGHAEYYQFFSARVLAKLLDGTPETIRHPFQACSGKV